MPEEEVVSKNVSKVIYDGQVLMDLTADTVTPDKLAQGVTAHDKAGNPISGTSTFDVDSTDATAAVSEILVGKTAYARGTKLTGTMPNNAAVDLNISEVDEEVTIPQGYHDGSGKVQIDPVEQAKLIAANVRQGVTILGVEGSMSSTEGANPQAKTVTPSASAQEILPDDGYNFLSSVTVNAIPYVQTENSAGGLTVTIAG